MKFLFTGAAGYIGSHTALAFLESTDCEVVILDNFSTGFSQNTDFLAREFGEKVSVIKCDLADTARVREILAAHKFDAVVHFAASLIVSESVEKPLLYYKNNTMNTTNLIEACIERGINRFIFSSTAAVYGEPSAEKMPINEREPLAPINPYGASKMMSEMVLGSVARAHPAFKFVALRYFNVAGAHLDANGKVGSLGQRSQNATHLIKVACEVAAGKRERMSVFGRDYPTNDGTCVRDYIHIDDLASAHLAAFNHLQNGGDSQIFNVGYSHGYSVAEVVAMVKKVSGVNFAVTDAPRRAGDPAALVSDNAKLCAATNWRPRYDSLEVIVRSAYEWEKLL